MPSPKHACQEKLALLNQYVAELFDHNADVRKHAHYLAAGLDGDGLTWLGRRAEQSKKRFLKARGQYTTHLEDHGC
jgi:hypothetical protein